MNSSKVLYERIIRARKETTYLMLGFIPSAALIVYFHMYTDYTLPLISLLALNIIHFWLLSSRSDLEQKYKHFGNALCPDCNAVVERSQVLDKPMPQDCKSCGLRVPSN